MCKTAIALTLALFLAPGATLVARADSPDEQLAAADALYQAKKYDEAAQKLDAFLLANPKHPRAGAAALVLGRCRTAREEFGPALDAYQRALDSKDADLQTQARLGLAQAAMQTKQYEKAVGALEPALKERLKPEQASVGWLWLGQADYQLKKYDEAENAYAHITRDYATSEVVDSALFGAGLAALSQHKIESARQRFQNVVTRYPHSEDRPPAELLLAQLDFDAKQYPQARAEFEDLLGNTAAKGMTPDLRQTAEDGLVQTLLEQKDYGAAATHLEAITARLPASDPERYRAFLSLGNSRYQQKQYAQARAAYLEAAKSADSEVASEGMYWTANAQLAEAHPEDAAASFLAYSKKYPAGKRAARAQLRAGDTLLDAKQSEAAARAYRGVLANYPQSPEAAEARKGLANITGSITDPTQLVAAIKTLQGDEKQLALLRLARIYLAKAQDANATVATTQYASATSTLNQLLDSNPSPDRTVEALYLIGVSYDAQQKFEQAIHSLAQAVQMRPNAPWAAEAQSRLAWLYLETKQPAKSETAANAGLALKPTPPIELQTRLALVQALINQKKWDAALETSKTLLTGNPTPETAATVLFTQAYVTEKQNKPDEALALWEKLASEHPTSHYAAEALLNLGDADLKAKKYAEAQAHYAKLLADFPKSGFVHEAGFKMGSALYNQDKFGEAGETFKGVANDKAAGEYIPEALYWAGVALDKAGKKDEAIARLTELITKYPTHARVTNAKIRLAALKAVAGK